MEISFHQASNLSSKELFWNQVGVLFKKNMLIYWRNKSALLKELGLPVIVSLWIYLSEFNQELSASIQFLFTVSLLGHIRSFMVDVMHEKSYKYREYLKINGVSNSAYITSMLLYSYLKCFIFGIISCSAFLFIKREDGFFSSPFIFFLYMLTGIACSHLALLITVFFKSPQFCADIGGFAFTLVSFLSLVTFDTQSQTWYYVSLIFPQNSLGYSLFFKSLVKFHLDGLTLISFVVFDAIIYLLLFIYLDQVVPATFGVKRNWCFCLKRNVNKRNTQTNPLLQENRSLIEDGDGLTRTNSSSAIDMNEEEDGSSALYHEKFQNLSQDKRTVFLENISKSFGNEKVIDNLSLMMYEKQVFCLLGHNGAGKTTTINLLTGLLQHDSGEIYYGGASFQKSIFSVRKSLGLCNQQDILYKDLTVYEHMLLMGRIRGIVESELQREIQKTLQKVGLMAEKDNKVSILSGGNKRRLSLGLAVLGDVKIVFLDEPTSGMDPNTRRTVWELIKELRAEGKTILLTTHHLDEADELSDRLGVMSKGKLFAVGTSDFIKRKFGVGYHLIVTPNYERNTTIEDFENFKETVQEIVSQHIDGAKRDEQEGNSSMKFLLPFSYQNSFAGLFEDLEKIDKLKLNLRMNSLEDAFINIGLQDELFFGEEANNGAEQVNVNIEPPRLIKSHISKYDFWSQLEAMFLRKYFYMRRNYKNLFLIIIPVLFVIFGTVTTIPKLRDLETEDFDNNPDTHANKNDPEIIERTKILETIIIFTFLFCVNFAYSMNSTIYCMFPVYEREFKITYALKAMGCRDIPYWLGTFLFDFLIIQAVNVFLILLVPIFQIQYIKDALFSFSLTLILFSGSLIALCYLVGFAFQSANSVFKSFGSFFFLVIICLPSCILMIVNQKNIAEPQSTLIKVVIYLLAPNFAFNESVILSLGQKGILFTSRLSCALWLLWLIVFYVFLSLYLHKRKLNVSIKTSRALQDTNFEYEEGVDVTEVNNEVTRLESAQNSDPVKVLHLNKVYPNGFKAVKDLSFGIQKGEIFGLLGPNGAGKSTTFHIATTMIPRSGGNVELKGQNIDSDPHDVFQDEGVCPQFDALWEDLQVLEHLYIYALIKGIPRFDHSETFIYLLDAVRLKEHQKKKAKELSGGNKRKLNTALSLMGTPSLKFLDEPSTGIDPISKRFLWTCLRKFAAMKNGSTLLTTHSMEEAEALCHRIGIIVNGRFVCLGPLQYLKDKYGAGYKITLVKRQEVENLETAVKEIFPEAEKIETTSICETYQVNSQSFKFSQALRALSNLKENRMIQDFSIYNTTLEQLFIKFSGHQREPDPSLTANRGWN